MTKRLTAFLLLFCAILMSVSAMAATTKEAWDHECNWVISRDTTLYSASFRDEATGAEHLAFTSVGAIAAGERVSIRSSANSMREIYYWNDGKCIAWVEDSAVIWAGGSSSGDGRKPEAVTVSDAWKSLDLSLYLGGGESKSVSLQVLGTAQSVVYDGTQMLTVNTEDLYWETEADDDERLGIVYAPKTGQATLRASASAKAKSLGQCEAGRIVVVLKVGSTFTRVLYDGKEGCILTSALKLCGAAHEDDFSTATLAYKGRTDSSATISVYAEKNTQRKIRQWRVGNDTVVLNKSGDWTEIEIGGWHGWCKSDYLE